VLGDIRVDFVQQRAWRSGKAFHLTVKEFGVLHLLAAAAGEPVSRDRFLDVVWGYTAFPTTRTVDKHIVSLRTKIEENADAPRWIQTVHGIGYRLELPRLEAGTAGEVTKS
jgi:DNA-binding response OmpR family regulator